MVLDPLSALSIAATVVQFLDFGTKLVSKTRELYKNVDGRTVEHSHIRGATDVLTSQCEALRQYVDVQSYQRHPVPGEEGMNDIVRRCLAMAEKLQRVLDELRVNGVNQAFESFRKAIKTLWKKDEINEMLASLNNTRAELTVSLLIVIRNENAVDVRELKSTTKKVESSILSAVQKLATDNRQQIKDLHRAATATRYFLPDRATQIQATRKWLNDNQALVSSFNDQVHRSAQLVSDQRIRAKICASLAFDEMSQRFDEIPDAQARTFAWVYDNEDQLGQKWPNFAKWLQDSDADAPGLYWISGKPGSGKSTLMRYLCNNGRTKSNLAEWSGSSQILIASCFFWNPGTRLQKSQQGLLRTLLFQLLTVKSEFPSFLFPRRWQLLDFGINLESDWSNEELQHAILTSVEYYTRDFHIVLFVDGLDEYEGNDEERLAMCDMLHELARNPAVKVCTSSRAWNIYRDAFRQDPMLRLEDLTREDIETFVVDKLENNHLYKDWSRSHGEQSYNLRAAIVEKAQGVFLWVRLVTVSLLTGLRNRDDSSDLERRLADIPGDLDRYFDKIMGTLDDFYLKEAGLMFKVALLGCHSLMTYYYLHDSSIQHLNASKGQTYTPEQVSELQEIEDRRINARCMGLLESFHQTTIDRRTPVLATNLRSVDFLHRTARDYIQSSAVYARISSWHDASLDVSRSILMSHLRLLKSVDLQNPWIPRSTCADILTTSMKAAEKVLVGDRALTQEIHESLTTFYHRLTNYETHLNLKTADPEFSMWQQRQVKYRIDFLGFSILCGMDSYVLPTLKDTTASQINSKDGCPYLMLAAPLSSLIAFQPLQYIPTDWRQTEAINLLLAKGADPNRIWSSGTPWGLFLDRLITWEKSGRPRSIPLEAEVVLFEITKAFIEHGAVDTVPAGKAQTPSGKRYTKYVRTLDPWKTIRRAFRPEHANELVKLLDNSAHSHWKAKKMRLAARMSRTED